MSEIGLRTPEYRQNVMVTVQGTRIDDAAAYMLLAIHEAGGTWTIDLGRAGAVRLTEEAVRMARAILHLAGARAEGTCRHGE